MNLRKRIYNKSEYLRARIGRKVASMIPHNDVVDKDADSLAIVAIVKNEADYIEEWVKYHILAGIDRFYLYDNGSTDETCSILQKYIDRGIVVLTKFPGKGQQFPAYNDALKKYRTKTKYMAFIDADEFLFSCEEKKTVKQQVEELFELYPEVGGLAINWRMFGSSGHVSKPEGGYLKTSYIGLKKMGKGITA